MAEKTAGGITYSGWIALILYIVFGGLGVYLGERFHFPSDSVGGDPPWYFIRRDAIEGLCYIPILVICVTLGAIAIQKKIEGGWTLIGMGVLLSASHLWQLGLIYLRSDHIFDPVEARTSWPDFESYLGDPLHWGWVYILLPAAIVIAARRFLKNRVNPPGTSQA